MSGADGEVLVSVEDGVGRVVLDRPSHRNALSRSMCLELVEACARLDADPEVLVITLRGSNGDFCAGAGLDQLEEVLFDGADPDGGPVASAGPVTSPGPDPDADPGTGASAAHGIDRISQADAAIRAVRKPTVALVEGICMGGGWQVAAAADLVLASSTTRIAITPSKLGIIYPRPGLERLAERAGIDRAKYLLLTAAEVSPQQAHEWGLVTLLVDRDDFEAQTALIVDTIRSRSLFSNASHKRLLDEYAGTSPSRDRSGYDRDWARTWGEFRAGQDLAEGRRAFAAREAPVFHWRLDGQ